MKKFNDIAELFDHAEREAGATTLTGTVKRCDDDERHFMFSPGNCSQWIKIPRDGVDEVAYLGQTRCHRRGEESHSHPIATLRLTSQCIADLPHLSMLAEVIRQQQLALRRLAAVSRLGTRSGAGGQFVRQAASPCFYVMDEQAGGIVVCCCDDNGDNCECTGIG